MSTDPDQPRPVGSSEGTSRTGSTESDENCGATGSGLDRREDARFLTGSARYTADRTPPDALHLAFVRSDCGHGDILGVDISRATRIDGVRAVYTWADVEASRAPGRIPVATAQLDHDVPGHPILATDRIRYHGQPVAAVIAADAAIAADGVEAVTVRTERREAVVDPHAARQEDAPTLFETVPDNVVLTSHLGDARAVAEAFEDADTTVELDLQNNRLIPSAIEPRAALAQWSEEDDQLVVEMTSQTPHRHRSKLAHTLGRPEREIRVVSPSVGGGFGHKGHHHPGEAMAAWATTRLDRPVAWTATRSGNYLAGAHGRDHRTTAAIAADEDGTIRGLRVETDAAIGGYGLGSGPVLPGWYGRLLSSQYRIPAIFCETNCVCTNTAPVHSYRGAGRPEAIYVTERLVDVLARELGMDPVQLRRRNQIPPEELPYETPVGATYDSGEYERTMDVALELVADAEPVQDGETTDRYWGIGYACYVESTGGGFESGTVRIHPDGTVTAYVGTHSHGQGHETTYAQIVADELGLEPDDVAVVEGDTERIPRGTGTFGSRSTIVGGNAVAESATTVRTRARRIAAHVLDVPTESVTLSDEAFVVAGDRETRCTLADVASIAYDSGLPDDLGPGLEATTFYEAEGAAYTFGTHVAIVSIDPTTGETTLERYVAVDDCGEQINPTIVEGQVHGGVAQGIGQALFEQTVYDETGQLLTDSMLEYGIPRAGHLPDIESETTVTPSPRNELGVKGIGEAGTIAAPPAIVNAVVDALEPLGVTHVDMPLTDEAVWRAITDASA